MEDSGQRQTFEGGAQKELTDDKARVELIPPAALLRVGKWYGEGAKKYDDRNWEKGIPFSVCLGSLFRHYCKYAIGDRSEDHLAAIVFWANAIIYFEDTGRSIELDDLPVKRLTEPSMCPPIRTLQCPWCMKDKPETQFKTCHTFHGNLTRVCNGCYWKGAHEKNLKDDLTSDKKVPTIGRDWKVKKTFRVDDGTVSYPFALCCGVFYHKKTTGWVTYCRTCDKELNYENC